MINLRTFPLDLIRCILLALPLQHLYFLRSICRNWCQLIGGIFFTNQSIGLFYQHKRRTTLAYRRKLVCFRDSFNGTLPTPLGANFVDKSFNVASHCKDSRFVHINTLPELFPRINQLCIHGSVVKSCANFDQILSSWAPQLTSLTLVDFPADPGQQHAHLINTINQMHQLKELRLFDCDLPFDDLILGPHIHRISIGNKEPTLMDVDRLLTQLGPSCTSIWLDNVDVTAGTFETSSLGPNLTHFSINRMHFTCTPVACYQLLRYLCERHRKISHLGANFCLGVDFIKTIHELSKLPSLTDLTLPLNYNPDNVDSLLPQLAQLPTVHHLHITLSFTREISMFIFFRLVRHICPNLQRLYFRDCFNGLHNQQLGHEISSHFGKLCYRDQRTAALVLKVSEVTLDYGWLAGPHDLDQDED